MEILHEYNQMPALYSNVYTTIRYYSGKELHRYVTRVTKAIEKKQLSIYLKQDFPDELIQYIENGVSQSETELIKSLLPYKYNVENIHPRFEIFKQYIDKIGVSKIEIRKIIGEILKTEFFRAFSREEVKKLKGLIKEIDIDEIFKKIDHIIAIEKERTDNRRREKLKKREKASAMNQAILDLAPKVIKEVEKKDNFFTRLQFNKDNVGFFITPHIGKSWEIIIKYLENSTNSEQLNIELDDDNNNYFVSFFDDEDWAVMQSLLSNQYYEHTYTESLEGFKLLGIPIQLIIQHCQYNDLEIRDLVGNNVTNKYTRSIKNGIFAFNNVEDPIYSKDIYSKDSIRFVIEKLMRKTQLESEIHLACYLHYNFLLPMSEYVTERNEYFTRYNIFLPIGEFKKVREEIYQKLVVTGKAKVKWKNEASLYKLVVHNYPDAIYQYRSKWLDGQSIDIYLPSIKTGIEYQGRQHYEPIKYFGGEEAFVRLQKLDALKIEKCRKNGVRLIHWSYKDRIFSKANLKRKLNEDKKGNSM